jgi:hypothetical protein
MKTLLSLSALLITLTLTAQTNTATWYLNDTSNNGIQSPTNTASGPISTAMGYYTTASGNNSMAMGWNTEASGDVSTAMGTETTASGGYSFAMGYTTTASGVYSTAMGAYTTASGVASTAMGASTTATGDFSIAKGAFTTASDRSSLVIGENNLLGSTVTNSATQFSLENTAFVIGNGADENNRSDALTVLFDGTTNVAGSVTATEFIGDGSQLTNLPTTGNATFNLNEAGPDPSNGYSQSGIQSPSNQGSGANSFSVGHLNTSSGAVSTTLGGGNEATESYSTAMGWESTASGITSTAMGGRTIASGGSSTAMGQDTTASGLYSTAMGQATKANGPISTALGFNTTASGNISFASGQGSIASGTCSVASGWYSTASGSFSFAHNGTASGFSSTAITGTASGQYSTAMGLSTTAGGDFSTAMGYETKASDYNSFVIGRYNLLGSTVTNSAPEFNSSSPAFVIGNGYTNAPFVDDGRSDALTVLFDGTTTIAGSVTATEFIGDGSQLTNINYDNITFPIWRKGDAGGVEFGSSTASGYMAVAMGYDGVFASGWNSTAMGHSSGASGDRSTAMGAHTRASGNTSTAMGFDTTASGSSSTAMGVNTTASDYNSLVVGRYNLLGSTVTNSATEFSLENTAFVIGNGSGWDSSAQQTNRSDALTVLFDGTTTIAGDLSINSDARLKANIISLGSTLAKLLQIDGKTYTMKKDENKKQKIGVLAQDIEKVFPELVSESNGVKSVNYQGLVPVLINALKEQNDRMKVQQSQIDELKTIVQGLIK